MEENNHAKRQLLEAVEDLYDASIYVPDYFREKWNYTEGRMLELKNMLEAFIERHADAALAEQEKGDK